MPRIPAHLIPGQHGSPTTRALASVRTKPWLDLGGRFKFGKHSGEQADSVVQSDRRYIQWVVDEVENIDEADRDLLSALLTHSRSRR